MMMNKSFHLALGFLILIIFGAVWYFSEQDAHKQMHALKEQRKQVLENARNNPEIQKIHAPKSEATRKLLLWGYDNKFEAVAFPNQEGLWYLHQDWRELPLNRSTLSARVNENGQLALVSHYTGNEALGHSQVLIKIGQTVYDSTYIPYYPQGFTNSKLSKYWEVNQYSASPDQEIIRQIILAGDQEVQVLMRGETEELGFVLSETDKKAIRDCYHLYQQIHQG